MDEALWSLFWTTGLPEVYSLAKETAEEPEEKTEEKTQAQAGPSA